MSQITIHTSRLPFNPRSSFSLVPMNADSCWVLHTAILRLPSTEPPFLKGEVFECLTADFTISVSGQENIEVTLGVACILTCMSRQHSSGSLYLAPLLTIVGLLFTFLSFPYFNIMPVCCYPELHIQGVGRACGV